MDGLDADLSNQPTRRGKADRSIEVSSDAAVRGDIARQHGHYEHMRMQFKPSCCTLVWLAL